MNKTELIAAMAEASGLSKKDCEAALAAFITTTESALKAGNKVQLVGFGSFEVKERAARTGKNPATGEQIDIPASKAPAFKAGKAFNNALTQLSFNCGKFATNKMQFLLSIADNLYEPVVGYQTSS